MKFFEIVTLVFILLGCSSTEVQRYKDIFNPSQSKVAVIFKYQVLPKEKVAKENFEKVLAAKGFEVVEFEPFDSTLDYLIVAITENNYRNDYIKATFVDYKKREIVGSFTYTPFSSLNIKKTTKLLEKMLDAPIKHPDIETSLENGESKGFLSRDDDVRNLIDEREYAPKRLAVLKKDSVGKPLVESFELYQRLVKTKDSSLVVPMEKNRNEFFAGWKHVSDSICNSVNADDSLVADIRSIYETVLMNDVLEKGKHMPKYRVLYNWTDYWVALDSSLETVKNDNILNVLNSNQYEWEKIQVGCPNNDFSGQEVLVLTNEYRELLNTFMGIKERAEGHPLVDVYTVPGFEEIMSRIKFFEPAIPVKIQHDAYALDYLSYPIISRVIYNNVFNVALFYVWEGSAMYSIRLIKNDGKWQIVEKNRELIL